MGANCHFLKILLVGGTFDNLSGKPSSYINKFKYALINDDTKVVCYNGGNVDTLKLIQEKIKVFKYDAIIWCPNIPNDIEKLNRNLKTLDPNIIYVASKRNNNEYSFQQLVSKALQCKANLLIEFNTTEYQISGRLIDPLGNEWCPKTCYIQLLADTLIQQLHFLKTQVTRQGTISIRNAPVYPEFNNINEYNDFKDFLYIIKQYAEVYHNLICPDVNTTRFLGNSSFRCTKGGFPSFRAKTTPNLIFVSERNIDKRSIEFNNFVGVNLTEQFHGKVGYYGDRKPSVDTPIQLKLYKKYPWINYIIHSHVYLKNTPFTKQYYPCGALQEFDEICETINKVIQEQSGGLKPIRIAINLIGHGCIVLSTGVAHLKDLPYIAREFPEQMYLKI